MAATVFPAVLSADLSREQMLELYYWMRLTRTLEERLVALYRQTKVVGGLFRSLGQEADAVGSAYALDAQGDVLSPLIRNLGSMLVKGATPVEILKQYMAKGDSPTRGRELNIHFGDPGARVHRPDLAARRHGAGDGRRDAHRSRCAGEDRVGLVYVGDGATSTGAFHEGINFAAVQRCRWSSSSRTTATPTRRRPRSRPPRSSSSTRRIGYGVPGEQADGNDVLAVYDVTKRAVDRARAGRRRHAGRADDVPPKGPRGARQPVVRARGRDRAVGGENDPIDRYVARLRDECGVPTRDRERSTRA